MESSRVIISRRPLQAARNDDVLLHLLVHGRDVILAGAMVEGAYDRRVPTRQHSEDPALGSSVFLLSTQLHQYLVAVHGRSNCRRRNENVAFDRAPLPGIWDDEAIAVAVHREASGDEVLVDSGVFGKRVTVTPGFDQACALDQSLKPFRKLLAFLTA